MYPNERDHKWAFGDLSDDLLKKCEDNPHMNELLTEASPFDLQMSEIKFLEEFKDTDRFKPFPMTEEERKEKQKTLD